MKSETFTVETVIRTSMDNAWQIWTMPEHIVKWNHALNGWHTILAKNDLREGEKFYYRMETKSGDIGLELSGIYNEIKAKELIVYTTEDGRKVRISFMPFDSAIKISETIEPENSVSLDEQKCTSQAILDNFKKYVETHRSVLL